MTGYYLAVFEWKMQIYVAKHPVSLLDVKRFIICIRQIINYREHMQISFHKTVYLWTAKECEIISE